MRFSSEENKKMNQEIFEGLRRAVLSGESLRNAMMTFYNSGYLKQEIEEAARALQIEQIQSQGQFQQQQMPKQIQQQPQAQQTSLQQKVSAYEQPKQKKGIRMIIFLIFIILVLIGALISTFIFKDEIIEFFRKSFGA